MSVTDKSVFTRVESRNDRLRIFNTCIETRTTVPGQSELGTRFTFRPFKMEGIHLSGDLNATKSIALVEFVTVLFAVGEERYLTRTRFKSIEGPEAILDLDCAVFKLQRRDNFRVAVQQMKGARFELEHVNGNRQSTVLNLLDVSAGGVGAEMGLESDVQLRMKDIVKGRILIPGYLNEQITGEVRYLKPKGSAGSGLKHVGIRFIELTPALKQEFSVRVLEIHREYFSKLEMSR